MKYIPNGWRQRLLVCIALGVLVAGVSAQESLLNMQGPAPAYAPVTPPAASNPGVLEAPALVARNLNESDAEYTARMREKQQEVKAETARLLQHHEAVMRDIVATFGVRKEPRFRVAAEAVLAPAQGSRPSAVTPATSTAPASPTQGALLNN